MKKYAFLFSVLTVLPTFSSASCISNYEKGADEIYEKEKALGQVSLGSAIFTGGLGLVGMPFVAYQDHKRNSVLEVLEILKQSSRDAD